MSVVAEELSDQGLDGASMVAVEALRVRGHVRSTGLDEEHVAALAELDGRWPPILVWADQPSVVIDGAHRLAAAKRVGLSIVGVVLFHGDADEAFVEAVRRNVAHGLPLSVSDRISAGEQILRRHPDWSDRRIAEACALSPHTVARLRTSGAEVVEAAELGRSARVVDIESRLGRDGRSRPAQPGMVRERVVDALRANPSGSLREIASVARVSPETVRRIRRDVEGSVAPVVAALPRVPPAPADDWRDDPAMASSDELAALVEWLERTEPGNELASFAACVPLSRIYELSDEARRRAAFWSAFASALEARARGRAYSLP